MKRAYFEYEGCDLEDVHFFGVVPPVLRGGVWGCTGEAVAHCLDGDEDDACEGHYRVVRQRGVPFAKQNWE